MQESRPSGGSASRWGPLFGARARDWAETWEGPGGWGTPVYEHVLDRTSIGSGTRVLDCGCGAGRFARMAAVRAFVGAGPTGLAIGHSGESAVAQGVRDALGPYSDAGGRVKLPGWYRAVVAHT